MVLSPVHCDPDLFEEGDDDPGLVDTVSELGRCATENIVFREGPRGRGGEVVQPAIAKRVLNLKLLLLEVSFPGIGARYDVVFVAFDYDPALSFVISKRE